MGDSARAFTSGLSSSETPYCIFGVIFWEDIFLG